MAPDPSPTPEPKVKPSGVFGHVCSRCGHWDDHCGPRVNAGGQIVIDLAGMDASIDIIKRLRLLQRTLPADKAKELDTIISEYEVRK